MAEQPSRAANLWYRLVRGAVGIACRLLFAYRVQGARQVPRTGPLLLLANHQSYLDPLILPVACPRRLRFMARDTLFTGGLGWLIDSLGAIPIDRDGASITGIKRTLKCLGEGQAVLVFPEGTRSGDGRLAPLKPGFLALVRRRQPTLAIVALDGAQHAWPRDRRFPRAARVAIHFGRLIEPGEYAGLDDEGLLALVAEELQRSLDRARRLRESHESAAAAIVDGNSATSAHNEATAPEPRE
jgi:1-acyl-sn-glycerol-3-phosphate acyltransferase